ncbi:MAG: hypothetical protein WBF90_33880 [Rivularia sp. (in: cyanobacteria)]
MVNYNRLRPRALLVQNQHYAPNTYNPAIQGGEQFKSGARKVFQADAAEQGLRTTMTRAGQTDKRGMRLANINQYAPDDGISQAPAVLFQNPGGEYQYARVMGVNPLDQNIFGDAGPRSSPEQRLAVKAARNNFNVGEGGNSQYYPVTMLGGYQAPKGKTARPGNAQVIPLDQPFSPGKGFPAVGGDALQMRYEMIGEPIPENRLPVRAQELLARKQAVSEYYDQPATTGFYKDNTVKFNPYPLGEKVKGQATPIPNALVDPRYPENVLSHLGYIRSDNGGLTKVQGTGQELDAGLGYVFNKDGREIPLNKYDEEANARFNIFRRIPLNQQEQFQALYPNQPDKIDVGMRRVDMQGVEKELRDINYLIKDHGREISETYYGSQYTEPGLEVIEADIKSRVNPLLQSDNRSYLKGDMIALEPGYQTTPANSYTGVAVPRYVDSSFDSNDVDLFGRIQRMDSQGQSMTTADDITYGRRYVPSSEEVFAEGLGYDQKGYLAYTGVDNERLPALGDFYSNTPQTNRIKIQQPNLPQAQYQLASVNEFGMPTNNYNLSYVEPNGYNNTLTPPRYVRATQTYIDGDGNTLPVPARGRWIGGGNTPRDWQYGTSKRMMKNSVAYDPLDYNDQINVAKGGRYVERLETTDPRVINARAQQTAALDVRDNTPEEIIQSPFNRQYKITETGNYTTPNNNDVLVDGAVIPAMQEVAVNQYEPRMLPFISKSETLADDLADVRVMVGNSSYPLTPEATTEPYLLNESQQNERNVEMYRRRKMRLSDDYYELQEPSLEELAAIQQAENAGVVVDNFDADISSIAKARQNSFNREVYADPTIEPTDALSAIEALKRRERELNIAVNHYREPQYFDVNETALANKFGGTTNRMSSGNPENIYSRPRNLSDTRYTNNNGNVIPASPSINRFINEEEAATIAASANIRPVKTNKVMSDDGTYFEEPTDYIGYVSQDNIMEGVNDGSPQQRLSRQQLIEKRDGISHQVAQAENSYNQLMALEAQPEIRIDAYAANAPEALAVGKGLLHNGRFIINHNPQDITEISAVGSFNPQASKYSLPTTRNRQTVEIDPEIEELNFLALDDRRIRAQRDLERTRTPLPRRVSSSFGEESLFNAIANSEYVYDQVPTRVDPALLSTPEKMQAAQDMVEAQIMGPSYSPYASASMTKQLRGMVQAQEPFGSYRQIQGPRYQQFEATPTQVNEQVAYGQYRPIQGPSYSPYASTDMTNQLRGMKQTQEPFGQYRPIQGPGFQPYDVPEQPSQQMSALQKYAVPLGIGGTVLGASTLNNYAQQQEREQAQREAELQKMYGVQY